jgi:hypothetical protein
MPRARAGTDLSPEAQLIPALFASFAPPVGLLLFGWAARSTVHWIVPTIGIIIYPAGVFILMQCIFLYIPASYPQYAASLFAANDAFRCSFACGAVIFATPLYRNLGIGPGSSLLAGLTLVCAAALFLLYRFGAALRARSKFTSQWWSAHHKDLPRFNQPGTIQILSLMKGGEMQWCYWDLTNKTWPEVCHEVSRHLITSFDFQIALSITTSLQDRISILPSSAPQYFLEHTHHTRA